jgi:hypothetical protein
MPVRGHGIALNMPRFGRILSLDVPRSSLSLVKGSAGPAPLLPMLFQKSDKHHCGKYLFGLPDNSYDRKALKFFLLFVNVGISEEPSRRWCTNRMACD